MGAIEYAEQQLSAIGTRGSADPLTALARGLIARGVIAAGVDEATVASVMAVGCFVGRELTDPEWRSAVRHQRAVALVEAGLLAPTGVAA